MLNSITIIFPSDQKKPRTHQRFEGCIQTTCAERTGITIVVKTSSSFTFDFRVSQVLQVQEKPSKTLVVISDVQINTEISIPPMPDLYAVILILKSKHQYFRYPHPHCGT